MEVVINRCFGSFNLSDTVIAECIKRGMSVTAFNAEGYPVDDKAQFVDALDDTFGYKNKYNFARYRPIGCDKKEFRTNSTIISVIKNLGEKANGINSKLKVVEIPFNDIHGWEIDDYDGKEKIIPSSSEWC